MVGDYAFSDDLRGYASLSRGRRPNVVNLHVLSSEIIDDETVTSAELGLKGTALDGRFLYDVAAYHCEYTNFQATVRDDDSLRYVQQAVASANRWWHCRSISCISFRCRRGTVRCARAWPRGGSVRVGSALQRGGG